VSGEILDRRIGPHGLDVVTVAATGYVRPQITFAAGVADTTDGEQIMARVADTDTFVMVEPRRSARDDRRR
jgi:hypothetical protein